MDIILTFVAASVESSDPIREALLDAAADVFADAGYAGSRVQEIAERAGVTTGAIYNRFSGKAELLLEALEKHTNKLLETLSSADLSGSDVLALLGASLLRPQGPSSLLVLESFMAARREPDVAESLRPRLADDRARLAKLVDEEKANGVVDPGIDTTSMVTFCQAVGLGMQLLSTIDTVMPEGQAWDDLIHRLIASLSSADNNH